MRTISNTDREILNNMDLPNIQPIGPIERSPEQEIFSLQAQLKNLEKQLRMDKAYNDDQTVINTSVEMAAIQKRIQELLQESGRPISNMDREILGESGRTMSNMGRQNFVLGGLAAAVRAASMAKKAKGIGATSPLASQAVKVNPGLYAIPVGSALPGAEIAALGAGGMLADATNMFTEPPSRKNIGFNSPEALGKDLANMKMGVDKVVAIATNEARKLGQEINQYVNRVKLAYNEQMQQPPEVTVDKSNFPRVQLENFEADRPQLANGGEIDAMLGGMEPPMGEEEAMGELNQIAPEMNMIDQLVKMVAQMIQQGANEQEIIMFLREQGLDDEDIGTVLQLVAEMAESQAMPQNNIGAELEQLG
mgnify:FL=1|tara:strand:- start:915 stop:2009 length:1095 start_codon:yes stop_codon:yes gene_type:complete